MNAIRILTRPETNGELALRNLPVKKDQPLKVIIVTQEEPEEDDLILSLLQHDPGYIFLRDSAENLYTETDA